MHELPSIPQLLVSGGDDRIVVIAGSGANRYGIRPFPQPGLIEFSSSTASHVSPRALAAIERFRQRVNRCLPEADPISVWQFEVQRVRDQFLDLWGLNKNDVQFHLQRSGSDAHAMASRLAYCKFGRAFRVIMGEPDETGSRVLQALRGGGPIGGRELADVVAIPVRNPDGSCRPERHIDQDFYRAVLDSLRDDVPVLIVRTDESKSGCVYPGKDLVAMLARQFPHEVAVLVDCAQLRCDAGQLEQYLAADYMVCVSGSKYFGAPAFCGALLTGAHWQQILPSAIVDIDRSDAPNFGLLARWQAALAMMMIHCQIARAKRDEVGAAFHTAVLRTVEALPAIELLDAIGDGRQGPRSLFALRLRHGPARRSLTPEEVEQVYRHLQGRRQADGFIYTLGQPVPCKGHDCSATQYLRISLSAPMLVDVCQLSDGCGTAWMVNAISAALQALNDQVSSLP